MPIKLKTSQKDIMFHIDKKVEAIRDAVISVLFDVGLQCVTEARNNPGYMDQTGNLRSSIGFCVVHEGQIVEKVLSRDLGDGGPSSAAGMSASDRLMERLAQGRRSGFSLIVAAGMSYAVYVEGRGRNVISSAELLAGRLVPRMLETLGFERQ